VVDRHSDGTYVLKALKQKLFVDGLCYLLQEIYGIENKNNDNNKVCFYYHIDVIPGVTV
jgi:excinuclease UvrABC nuclease subunit